MEEVRARLRRLREALDLSQDEFAARLGFTRGVVANSELGRAAIRPLYLQQVCREFNVSYDWLTAGEGEMFDSLPEVILDEVARQYDLDEMDKRIVQSYLDLPEEDRAAVKRYINMVFGK